MKTKLYALLLLFAGVAACTSSEPPVADKSSAPPAIVVEKPVVVEKAVQPAPAVNKEVAPAIDKEKEINLANKEAFNEGFEYIKLVPPVATDVAAGKVEVVEVFWYGCHHCYNAEPAVQKWLAQKSEHAAFVRVPAHFGPDWELHARAFYTAQLLNVGDKVHHDFFDAIHKKDNSLGSKDTLRKFFVEHGVSAQQFDETFDSFAVNTKVTQAKALVEQYGVNGVPTMIVNGKYRIGSSNADNSYEKMMRIVDFLVKKEAPPK